MSFQISDITALIDQDNFSLLPATSVGNKKPYIKNWGPEIPRLNNNSLIDLLGKYNADSVCAILGNESVGLTCIDVDVKHKEGFDAIIIKDIKELYPDIWSNFRVEKTPSGGYHFLYKLNGITNDNFPRSCNLASRKATEEELLIRPDLKKHCFLELKAQGGLAHLFPSNGYLRIKNWENKGILTWEQHCSLISLCRLYDEIIKEERIINVSNDVSTYYVGGSNPYECFNRSIDGSSILEEYGWEFFKKSGKYDYYKKPGKKDNNVSASWNNEKRLYKIWTTTTEIEPKSYSPANLLGFLRFNDNKKELFAYLVAKGYGQIKPKIEENLVKKIAKYGGELPANISEEAKEKYNEEIENIDRCYPYGVFWAINEANQGNKYKISREALYNVAREYGFRKHNENVCLIESYIIKIVKPDDFFNFLKKYIVDGFENGEEGQQERNGFDLQDILDCYESFLQNSGKFTISRLDSLDIELLLKSTKTTSYKFYSNCFIRITKEAYDILNYEEDLTHLIWENDIKKRNFETILPIEWKHSLYFQLLDNSIGFNDYLLKCIGFYAHDHRDEEGYMIIATESCENPTDGGGSGKNIFWNLFSLITTFKSTPASMINLNNNLLQSWDGQRIFCLSDMPKGFDIIFFKDIITGNATVNKKYINEYSIDISDMCKLGASSNYSFDDADPGVRRRVRQLEFGDYYTIRGGVKKVHGKMFPKEWSELDYLHFDNIMIYAIMTYLKSDNIIDKLELTGGGWIKQFEQKYNHLHEFIKFNIDSWISLKQVSNELMKYEYKLYTDENNIRKPYTVYTINHALQSYCNHHKIGFEYEGARCVWRDSTGKVVRGKMFFNLSESMKKDLEKSALDDDVPF